LPSAKAGGASIVSDFPLLYAQPFAPAGGARRAISIALAVGTKGSQHTTSQGSASAQKKQRAENRQKYKYIVLLGRDHDAILRENYGGASAITLDEWAMFRILAFPFGGEQVLSSTIFS
jgi:hypothetical protein